MPTGRHLAIAIATTALLVGCDKFRGPAGPTGPQGPQGVAGTVITKTGTIYNSNYTTANPYWASIPLAESGSEPIVLFFGVENANGVFDNYGFESVIWGGTNSSYTVPGTTGWYALVYDRYKTLATKRYQVKFMR